MASSRADCPAGSIVTGGGFDTGVRTFIGYAGTNGPTNGYFVIGINTGVLSAEIQAFAICARGTGITRAFARKASTASVVKADQRLLQRIRAEEMATSGAAAR